MFWEELDQSKNLAANEFKYSHSCNQRNEISFRGYTLNTNNLRTKWRTEVKPKPADSSWIILSKVFWHQSDPVQSLTVNQRQSSGGYHEVSPHSPSFRHFTAERFVRSPRSQNHFCSSFKGLSTGMQHINFKVIKSRVKTL